MFDTYNNSEYKYEIIFADKSKKQYTTQELFEFMLFNETNISEDFDSILSKLDSGFAILGEDTEYDFGFGGRLVKGPLCIMRITPPHLFPPPLPKNSGECQHQNKYINQAGGIRFWVCPACKKDLGNA